MTAPPRDAAEYRARRRARDAAARARDPRPVCRACGLPASICYCAAVRPFDSPAKVVILTHPIEAARRTATGRLAHLCIRDSVQRRGVDFSADRPLNRLLADPAYSPAVLGFGPGATDLTPLSPPARRALFAPGTRPLLVVIDGTWQTANKMLKRSRNLRDLPRLYFTPPGPSRLVVRKQPRRDYLSTAEAIHEALRLLDPTRPGPAADVLLELVDAMVRRDLDFRLGRRQGRVPGYRLRKREVWEARLDAVAADEP